MATSTAPATAEPTADHARPAGHSRLTRQKLRAAWLFLLPMLVVLVLVAAYPLARTIAYSLTDATLADLSAARFVGLTNFGYLVADPDWWRAVANTFVFTVVSVGLETVLGLVIALTLHAQFRGRGLLRTAFLIPWAIPTVVAGKMWAWMFNDVFGVINAMLLGIGLIGEPIAWLASPSTSLLAIILTEVWMKTPFMMLLLLAGLQMLPQDCYESAKVDGVSAWTVFWKVTLPLLKPALLVAIIFRTLDCLRVFDLIYVMTGNNASTMSMSVYARQQLVEFQDVGLGSAAATLLFAIIALFTVVYLTLARVGRED
ncbi:carbohydrate ABC transporter permease [Marinivivus vitaminiproducens]|uniref:carbohydrate ABC transporter permease n=1 Tax=Marinivivus vitaminiproducens TaxID=3035935 RepID=UPI0027A8CF19|nr:sugar ABC transporter permease [Geminicoccaceae bacterium SCSIO 64248]